MKTDWKFKVHAFLHDPPHKPFTLGKGHEAVGRRLAKQWVGEIDSNLFGNHIKPADMIASGADRDSALGALGGRDFWIDPAKEMTLVHPLDGRDLAVRRPEDKVKEMTAVGKPMFSAQEIEKACELVESLFNDLSPDMKAFAERTAQDTFLILWRFLPELLRLKALKENEVAFGPIWEFLPADTRMPTHPTSAHASLVSCLAELHRRGGKAAVLSFTVGPVQSFIHAARRLSDLWAGSFLLSNSLWAGLVPLVEEFGPDSVIYPTLRGQALMDLWLVEKWKGEPLFENQLLKEVLETTKKQLARRLRIPSLPNRFTALVPPEDVERIAAKCENAVREFWRNHALDGAKKLCVEMKKTNAAWSDADPNFVAEHAAGQIDELVEVSWATSCWELSTKTINEEVAERHALLRKGKALAKDELSHLPDKGFALNAGILYGDAYFESGRYLDATKINRLAPANTVDSGEEGLKCSLCGEREVLGPGRGSFYKAGKVYRESRPAKKSWLKDGEALCGVCWLKRYWGVEGARHLLGESGSTQVRHPSTGEVAASRFKKEILDKVIDLHLNKGSSCSKLSAYMAAYTKGVRECESQGKLEHGDTHVWCVEAVEETLRGNGVARDQLLATLAHTDGEFLLPYPRIDGEEPGEKSSETDSIKTKSSIEPIISSARALRNYAKKECNISPPRPYLAVIHLDGDKLGTWLSGEHARTPLFKDMFHPNLQEELGRILDEKALCRPRRVTPAVHAALSGACGAFSQVAAPLTVEGEGLCGHLVYAGGDDALLLAPAEEALELVRRLRLRFSGYPWEFDKPTDYAAMEGAEVTKSDSLAERAKKQPFRYIRGYTACRRNNKGMPRIGSHREQRELHLVFGERVTASAGMCVFHYTWPLSDAVHRASQAESFAKDVLGRNALGITVVRRSNSITQTGLKFTNDSTLRPDEGVKACAMDYIKTFQRLVDGLVGNVSTQLVKVLAAETELLHLAALTETGGLSAEERQSYGENAWKMVLKLAGRALRRRTGLFDQRPESEKEQKAGSFLNVFQVEEYLGSLAEACGQPYSGVEGIKRWIALLDTAAFIARQGD